MEKQQQISLDQIDKPRICLRNIQRSAPEFVELCESIKKDGVLQPILVRPRGKRYEIVEGWHRYEAAKLAGYGTISCLVRDLTDDEVRVFQVKCNAIRPPTRSFEYARRLKLLMEKGATLFEISAMVDKSPRWVQDQIQLNRICEEARPAVEDGRIKMTAALALANLPSEIQPQFVDEAVSLPTLVFTERAEAARRDFQTYILKQQADDREIGAARPTIRSLNILKREALKPRAAKEVLKKMKAKTPLDGWRACLAWAFKLDPVTVEHRKDKRKEEEIDGLLATNDEYRQLNRNMIREFVKSNTGDPTHE